MTLRQLPLRRHRPPRPLRRHGASAALLLVLAGTTACGSGPDGGAGVATAGGRTAPTASASPSQDPRDAAVAFAKCLREHGVQVADPDDRGTVTLGGDEADERALRAAHEACKDKAPAVGLGPSGGLDAAAQERMLKFARCMREHGVDMPDPGADGGVRMEIGRDVDPEDEEFRAAQQACRQWFAPGDGQDGNAS